MKMPPAEPPTPTHEEAREIVASDPWFHDRPRHKLHSYIAASVAKDARIAELEKSVDFWRDSLEACKRNGATLVERIAELEREVAELRAIRIPCDVCHREWCGGCTVQVGSPLRGQSMSLGDLVGEKKR
jgi:hypothetical protein